MKSQPTVCARRKDWTPRKKKRRVTVKALCLSLTWHSPGNCGPVASLGQLRWSNRIRGWHWHGSRWRSARRYWWDRGRSGSQPRLPFVPFRFCRSLQIWSIYLLVVCVGVVSGHKQREILSLREMSGVRLSFREKGKGGVPSVMWKVWHNRVFWLSDRVHTVRFGWSKMLKQSHCCDFSCTHCELDGRIWLARMWGKFDLRTVGKSVGRMMLSWREHAMKRKKNSLGAWSFWSCGTGRKQGCQILCNHITCKYVRTHTYIYRHTWAVMYAYMLIHMIIYIYI